MRVFKTQKVKKISLIVSVVLLVIWLVLGTFSTISWFTDTEAIVNRFIFGEVKVEVNHRVDKGGGNFRYEAVNESTKLFDDSALYEPGYMQVVYLQVKNSGTVDFDYRISVLLDSVQLGYTADNKPVYLPDYLRYAAVFGSSEAELESIISREYVSNAVSGEAHELNSFARQRFNIAPGQTEYVALIVYMPSEVDNAANYRGDAIPTVNLGISVLATQAGTINTQ